MKADSEKTLKGEVRIGVNCRGGDVAGCMLKIVANADEGEDCDMILVGKAQSVQEENNMTGELEIEYGEESFTVTPKGGVDDVLKGVYPNNEIGDCEGKGYADMYSLVITSYNGEASVTVHFSAYEEVCEITLDKAVIVF